jgi:N,N-dimethylformamidase
MGWDSNGSGYVRGPASLDPRAAFIFEGVAQDEVIGDFGLVMNSAAGDELDRYDTRLGSPRHALVLASSGDHSDFYQPVIEDFLQVTGRLKEIGKSNIHADMVYFETPNDGAVFSVGSICWCGSLSHNRYDNNVSRITENVLRKFMA